MIWKSEDTRKMTCSLCVSYNMCDKACGVNMIQCTDATSGCIGNAQDSCRCSSVRLILPMSHVNAHVVSLSRWWNIRLVDIATQAEEASYPSNTTACSGIAEDIQRSASIDNVDRYNDGWCRGCCNSINHLLIQGMLPRELLGQRGRRSI